MFYGIHNITKSYIIYIVHEIIGQYDRLSTRTNNNQTVRFQHAQLILKTDCFDAAGLGVLHVLVKAALFCKFVRVGVVTPQWIDGLGPTSFKTKHCVFEGHVDGPCIFTRV